MYTSIFFSTLPAVNKNVITARCIVRLKHSCGQTKLATMLCIIGYNLTVAALVVHYWVFTCLWYGSFQDVADLSYLS